MRAGRARAGNHLNAELGLAELPRLLGLLLAMTLVGAWFAWRYGASG
jgi:hypothetical protein